MASGRVLICDGCGKTVTRKPKDPKPPSWRRIQIYSGHVEGPNRWAADVCCPKCAADVVRGTFDNDELDDLSTVTA